MGLYGRLNLVKLDQKVATKYGEKRGKFAKKLKHSSTCEIPNLQFSSLCDRWMVVAFQIAKHTPVPLIPRLSPMCWRQLHPYTSLVTPIKSVQIRVKISWKRDLINIEDISSISNWSNHQLPPKRPILIRLKVHQLTQPRDQITHSANSLPPNI